MEMCYLSWVWHSGDSVYVCICASVLSYMWTKCVPISFMHFIDVST